MTFVFKSVQQILSDQLFVIKSQISAADILKGGVFYTIAQASALEDAQQYVAMTEILESINLDNISDEDLESRANEYGLNPTRIPESNSTGLVTIVDSNFSKVSTKVFSGTSGPTSGSLTINVENVDGFTTSGSIVVGRGSGNVETVPYTSITDNITYYTFNLSSAFVYDHGTDETVILSQGGIRTINVGTNVQVPETDTSDAILYAVTEVKQLLDGEDTVTGVPIQSQSTGTISNVPSNAISDFVTTPFAGATVLNPEAITNGRDEETDQELRDRIRNRIQSLSKGTITAVTTSIIGLTNVDDNKRVVSSTFIDPTDTTDIGRLYIDDGTGFEPSFEGAAIDTILNQATGNEIFLQLSEFPVVKASLITNNSELYDVSNGDTLIVEVSGVQETITFDADDFSADGSARAQEIAEGINEKSNLIEARTLEGRSKVIIEARSNTNESITLVGGTANTALQFPENVEVNTLKLYKDDVLLNKDGSTAFVETSVLAPYSLSNGQTLTFIVDGKSANPQTVTLDTADFDLIGNATAVEVAAAINKELSGATATASADGSIVRVTSNTTLSSGSKIQVTGGTANAVLSFPTTEVSGTSSDYTLNRLNGQVELTAPLSPGEVITSGSTNTRAFVDTGSAESYVINAGEILSITVDGGVSQVHTFTANGSFTAQQIVDQVSTTFVGMEAFVIQKQTMNYVRFRTNSWDDTVGSIKIDAATDANLLNLPEEDLRVNGISNVAYIETENVEDFILGRDQNIFVAIDDGVENIFNITLQANGEVTTSNTTTVFRDSNLGNTFPTDDSFIDFNLQFNEDTSTTAIRNEIRAVTDYDATTGEFTVASAFSAAPAVGDAFKLVPVKAKNVVELLTNKNITSLSTVADVLASDQDTRVQISTLTEGSEGAVSVTGGSANGFTIPFTSDGTLAGTFSVDSISGISIGLQVKIEDDDTTAINAIISNILSATPNPGFIVEVDNGVTDLTSFELLQNARVSSENGLNFSTGSTATGVDGYKYYTGLLQQIQQTIDGKDDDPDNFEGLKAAGVQIEVKAPTIKAITVVLDVTTVGNITISAVTPDVQSVVSTYINSLSVGEDVQVAEIICVVKGLESIFNVEVESPVSDIPINDNEIARIRAADIIVG